MSITLQICSCCGEKKNIDAFSKNRYRKSGYRCTCKSCDKIKKAEHYKKNKEKSKETTYRWREANRQYYLDYMKYQHGDNPDFVPKERQVKFTQEEILANTKKKQDKNNFDHKEDRKIWRAENKETLAAKQRARVNARRKNDPCFRIQCNLRDRVKKLTKDQNSKRLAEYDELFGCSIEQYRLWIETHWLPGMNWENWGIGDDKWNLDHHYPLSAFDLTQKDQQLIAMHHTNTYPMWAKDNLLKKDQIPDKPRENLYIPDFAKISSSDDKIPNSRV